MTVDADIRDQAYQFFIEEVPELLDIIEAGLLKLQQDSSTSQIHEIMRAAHSIKGGAASVGLEGIKSLAHRLETIFKALYSDQVQIDRALEKYLLQAYDCLRIPLQTQIEMGTFDEENALARAEPVFQILETELGEALSEVDHFMPVSAADLGIDMVASIFEIDVLQGLTHLRQVLAQPQSYEVSGELRAQAEVFAGFAGVLNLPGFGKIAEIAIAALDASPKKVLAILTQAIEDFEVARAAVLAGDRQQGGAASEKLRAFTQPTVALANHPPFVEEDGTGLMGLNLESDALLLAEIFTLEDGPILAANCEDLHDGVLPLTDIFMPLEGDQELADFELLSRDANDPTLEDIFGKTAAVEERVNSGFPEMYPLEIPEPEMPEPEMPEPEMSEPEMPEPEMPEPEMPEPEMPEPETSEPEIPEPKIPEPKIPEPKIPEPKIPEPKIPEPEIPELEIPEPDIYQALETLDGLYESLPAVTSLEHFTAHTPTHTPEGTLSSPIPDKVLAQPSAPQPLTARIALERLERLDNFVGELAINRNSLSLQNEQFQRTVRNLKRRFEQFRKLAGQLQPLSDKTLIASETVALAQKHLSDRGSPATAGLAETTFDTLEMDSYNAVHALLQELLEELLQLEESVEDVQLFAGQSNQKLEKQRQLLTQLRDELMWARMVPLGGMLNRFPRLLRELSTTYDKQVDLRLEGTEVLVDRVMLEKLYDPLLHLLRNAFDHGIEPPAERLQQGKPEAGMIQIRAYHQGSNTVIEIQDDGRGLDVDKIGQRAVAGGFLSAADLAITRPQRLYELIFEPGFSTAPAVSELSGRGMGLDIVRERLQTFNGKITLVSEPGQGTTFVLRIPLTLTLTKLVVTQVGDSAIAIPSDSIEEILMPLSTQLKESGGKRFLHWRDQLLPIYALETLLPYHCPRLEKVDAHRLVVTIAARQQRSKPLLIIDQGHEAYALEVNQIITEQELVIKPLGKSIAAPACLNGCTVLGDGSLVPVIDSTRVVNYQTTPHMLPVTGGENSSIARISPSQTATILVIDDSSTMRQMLALSLQKAGFRVIQARDGREALNQLQQNPSLQLIICDIEMPRMNGFEFLTQRRSDPMIANIPTVMLTSRSSDKHRQLAHQLGATDYFTKPYIEADFLTALNQLIKKSHPVLIPSAAQND